MHACTMQVFDYPMVIKLPGGSDTAAAALPPRGPSTSTDSESMFDTLMSHGRTALDPKKVGRVGIPNNKPCLIRHSENTVKVQFTTVI